MKAMYFDVSNKKQGPIKGFTKVSSHYLTRFAPTLSYHLALKLFCNPFSRREYEFKEGLVSERIDLDIEMGKLRLHKFKGGNKHILLTHGWADNSRSFSLMIKSLLDNDYTVWSLDHIGHGESEGNTSHLYGYILGLKKAIQFIEQEYGELNSLVTHSMGGIAALNLEEEFLKNKKLAILSLPVEMFNSMFEKVNGFGFSSKMMKNLLDHVSINYGIYWKNLSPENHGYKINDNHIFIHDIDDKVAPMEHINEFTTSFKANLHSTTGLGHARILRDKKVIEMVIDHLEDNQR